MRWVIATLLIFVSCSNHQYQKIGKYVYVDCFSTIHINKNCASTLVENPKTKEERLANMQGIQFKDTCELVSWEFYPIKFCSKCVNDEAYDHLSQIIQRNEQKRKQES